MKPLITISTCTAWEDDSHNEVLRQTWLKDCKDRIEYRFFVGGDTRAKNDLINVDIPSDGYDHLTFKTRESHRWALAQGYDYVFQCFPDTYVVVDRLLASIADIDANHQDYVGGFRGEQDVPQ